MQHPGLCFLGVRQPHSTAYRTAWMWHRPGVLRTSSWDGDQTTFHSPQYD
jgi:hypothetical protein